MAISKLQPMRSAEIDIIDTVNTLSDDLSVEISDREQGDTNLQNQIGEGFSSDLTVAQSISDIETEIGNAFDSQHTITAYKDSLDAFLGNWVLLNDTVVNSILGLIDVTDILDAFYDRFKIGIIDNITIPANDSVSTSHVFTTPFESTDSCIILAQVVTSELSTLFTYTLIDCAYSGFSYSIANSDADAHTVALGYVAIKVN